MSQYRKALPQVSGDFFLTDGGIETTLIYQEGLELPSFASFPLLTYPAGVEALRKYFQAYASLASRFGVGLILESATWRASADWAARLGYTRRDLAVAIRQSISLLEEIRVANRTDQPLVISGCIGPRGDGYRPDAAMSEGEAEAYHLEQIEIFAETAADMVSAITMNYTEEAIGIVRSAERVGMPIAISFTVETDGNLPTGETLRSAIERVDAATQAYPCYFMLNCAHPTHFEHVLPADEPWAARIRGIRANASRMSHAELNEASEVDIGDPVQLGLDYARLKRRMPGLNVMGGCCGTDHRHVEQIAMACTPAFRGLIGASS
jgi:S-methylmethionine-dependent homocysteine/selenocysteine methylase